MNSNLNKYIPNIFFYSSSSCMKLSISIIKSTLQIAISQAYDKTKKSVAVKGEKRYDHDNALIFSMNLKEATKFTGSIKSVIDDTYVGYKRDSRGADSKINYLEFYHTNKILTVKKIDKTGLAITINDLESKRSHTHIFAIGTSDLILLCNIIKSFCTTYPIIVMVMNSYYRTESWASYNSPSSNGKNYKNIPPQEEDIGPVTEEDSYIDNEQGVKDSQESNISIDDFWDK